MNQKLISIPIQNDCCFEPNYYFTTYANYISKQHLSYLSEKNSIWFFRSFRSNNKNNIHSFQRFYINRQMKIIKKCQIELGIITFMNKSNQILVQNKNAISIWQLDNSNNWVFHKNITIFTLGNQDSDELSDSEGEQFNFDDEDTELFECHGLNTNDDLLVETGYQRDLQFWQRSFNDNWICQQTIKKSRACFFREIKFNSSGKQLIVYDDFQIKLIILSRDQNDEQWKIIHEIQTDANYYFCFISNEIFAQTPYDLPILSLWKINLLDMNVDKLQDLQLEIYIFQAKKIL